MEDQFVPLHIAIELKELGFDEPCFGWYSNFNRELRISNTININGTNYAGIEKCYLAPLYQQVFEWFDKEYSTKVSQFHHFTTNEYLGGEYYLHSYMFSPIHVGTFMDDKEAQIACINKMIEIFKTFK